jgi:hypothetical protein
MYLISKEYTYFQNTLRYEIYQVDKHLAAYEHFLSLSNNLFISLDISIILIYLLSGVLGKRGVKGIQFNNKSIKLLKQKLDSQYFNLDESVLSENIKLLKTIRNNRAHRPHINWDRGKIVSSQKDLNKVRSVCERESLFNQDIFTFIEQSISESSNIVLQILKSSRNIYEARLNKTITITQPHKDWHEFLS